MRKIILVMSVSSDGFFERPDRDISWHLVDDELHRYLKRRGTAPLLARRRLGCVAAHVVERSFDLALWVAGRHSADARRAIGERVALEHCALR